MPPKDSYIIEMNPQRKNMTNHSYLSTQAAFNGTSPINGVCSDEGGA